MLAALPPPARAVPAGSRAPGARSREPGVTAGLPAARPAGCRAPRLPGSRRMAPARRQAQVGREALASRTAEPGLSCPCASSPQGRRAGAAPGGQSITLIRPLTAKKQDCYRSGEDRLKCSSHIYLCNVRAPRMARCRRYPVPPPSAAPPPSGVRCHAIRHAVPTSSWAGTGTGAGRQPGVPGDRGTDRVVLSRQHPGARERRLREAPGQRRVPEHGRYR